MTDRLTDILNAASAAPGQGATPSASRMRVGIAVVLLALYVAIILIATMSPTPLDRGYEGAIDRLLDVLHRNGVPLWFGYSKLEFTANVLMFMPLGFLVGLALPRRIAWTGILLLPGFSAAIEFAQSTLLAERFATLMDVVANSTGGWVGLLVAFVIRAMVHARDEKVIARALWDRGYRL